MNYDCPISVSSFYLGGACDFSYKKSANKIIYKLRECVCVCFCSYPCPETMFKNWI